MNIDEIVKSKKEMSIEQKPILHKKLFQELTTDALGYAALLAKNSTNF